MRDTEQTEHVAAPPEPHAVELARRHILHDTRCIARHTSATSCSCDWAMRVATLAGDIAAAEKRGEERGRRAAQSRELLDFMENIRPLK